jgi:hypothetical protein
MTNLEYLQLQLGGFGVSDNMLVNALAAQGIAADAPATAGDAEKCEKAMCAVIPGIYARLQTVSEGGYSVSWNFDGIRLWYSSLVKKYGLQDELSTNPKLTNASNRW